MPGPGPWLALAAVAILLWYLAEWDQARSGGRRLSPLRHPALLFVQAIGKLARARQFMLPLLGFWLLSGVVYWGFQRPALMRQLGAPAHDSRPHRPDMAQRRLGGFRFEERPVGVLLRDGWEQFRTLHGRLPGQALDDSVPGPNSLRADLWGGYSQLLFTTLVLLCLASLVWHRPDWLGRANVLQPRLALAYLLVPLALMAVLVRLQGQGFPGWLPPLVHALTMLACIPLYGPLWHVLLQVAQGRRHLSLGLALRGTMACLIPLTGFLALVLVAPALAWSLLQGALPVRSDSLAGSAGLLWHLPVLLQLALLFVPWIILRDRADITCALRRHWQLLRAHAPDLLVFALRALLILFPLQALHATLSPFEAPMGASIIGHLIGGLTDLVSLAMVALLYLELERATPRLPAGGGMAVTRPASYR
ncbi:hypothetical protein LLH23_02485 [bacterium]|nr:hypothetical protein [bacterium]